MASVGDNEVVTMKGDYLGTIVDKDRILLFYKIILIEAIQAIQVIRVIQAIQVIQDLLDISLTIGCKRYSYKK